MNRFRMNEFGTMLLIGVAALAAIALFAIPFGLIMYSSYHIWGIHGLLLSSSIVFVAALFALTSRK